MNDQKEEWLVRQLIGTSELLGQQISPTAAAMLADDLSSYPQEVLARALTRVRTEHTGRLTPKAILDRIDEASGRPTANEAWAIAVTALDERATLVWTGEMADAWTVARPLAQGRDLVGARMAFIAAYERLVRSAREQRALPVVSVSIGWDASQRDAALEKAVQLGYLSYAQAAEHGAVALPAPVFNPMALLAGRIEPAASASPAIRKRLTQMRDELAQRAGRAKRREEAQNRLERIKARRQKEQLNALVQQRLQQEAGAA